MVGALIALAMIPFAPPGVPILAAMLGAVAARFGKPDEQPSDALIDESGIVP